MKYDSEKWDERYCNDEYAYGTEPNLFLKQNVNVIPKGNILCVADGEGRNGVWLARQGYNVISIDFSPKAIEKSEILANKFNVEIENICDDLLEHDFGKDKYNGIVSIFSHFRIEEIKKLHKKYYEALKLNGVFFMEAFAKEQLPLTTGGPKKIDLLYDLEAVKKSFPNGKIELLKKDIVYLHEGELHDGKAVVVRAIISKPSMEN